MRFLYLIIISILLSSCGSGYSVFNAFIDEEYSDGGVIWNHQISSTGYSGIETLAHQSCTSKGYKKAVLGSMDKQGEFSTYRFKCMSTQDEIAYVRNAMDQYIERCEYLGFKRDTEKMGDCALKFYQTEKEISLLSAQERQANSQNLLNKLLILDKSLQLLSPPRVQMQNRRLNCFYNQVGGRGVVNCR